VTTIVVPGAMLVDTAALPELGAAVIEEDALVVDGEVVEPELEELEPPL
jgi:hypothetical protein